MAETEDTGVDFSEGDSLMVDLNDVEDSSFEVMPKAMYPCIIDELEFSISQSGGNPMWTYKLEIEDGEFAGRTLFCHHVFRGKGLPITKRQLERIAPELLENPFDPQDQEVMDSLVGRRIKVKVGHQRYEGETRNNVKDFYPADDADSFT